MSSVDTDRPAPLRSGTGESLQDRCLDGLGHRIARPPPLILARIGVAGGRLFASVSALQNGQCTAALAASLLAMSESPAAEERHGHRLHLTLVARHGAFAAAAHVPGGKPSYRLSIGADAAEATAAMLRPALGVSEPAPAAVACRPSNVVSAYASKPAQPAAPEAK